MSFRGGGRGGFATGANRGGNFGGRGGERKFSRKSRLELGLTKFSSDRSRRLPAVVRSARAGSG